MATLKTEDFLFGGSAGSRAAGKGGRAAVGVSRAGAGNGSRSFIYGMPSRENLRAWLPRAESGRDAAVWLNAPGLRSVAGRGWNIAFPAPRRSLHSEPR